MNELRTHRQYNDMPFSRLFRSHGEKGKISAEQAALATRLRKLNDHSETLKRRGEDIQDRQRQLQQDLRLLRTDNIAHIDNWTQLVQDYAELEKSEAAKGHENKTDDRSERADKVLRNSFERLAPIRAKLVEQLKQGTSSTVISGSRARRRERADWPTATDLDPKPASSADEELTTVFQSFQTKE